MERYKKILLENRIKPTLQRIKIMEYLQKCHEHPTVDMIYADLHKKVPTLSKTTVYNAMEIFKAKGLVNALNITKSELRFEFNEKVHHHFLCRICHTIIDITTNCEYQKLLVIDGHQIEEIHGTFEGICKNCLAK